MAGTQRSHSPSAMGMDATPRMASSPTGSIDSSTTTTPRRSTDVDLLTGLYSALNSNSNPFLQEAGVASPISGSATSNSPPGCSASNPNSQDLMFNSILQQQHEPLDLLTGLFPPPSSAASVSPVTHNAWTTEILGFGGGGSGELFAAPAVGKSNNPFLDNAVMSPAFSPPLPLPGTPRLSNAGEMLSQTWSGSVDDLFAKFPPFADSPDLGRRPYSSSSGGPASTRYPTKPHSVGSSPTEPSIPPIRSGSLNFSVAMDSVMTSDGPLRHSSVPSGIGLERLQNGFSKAESSSRYAFQQRDSSPSTIPASRKENARRSPSEPRYDQRPPPLAGSYRSPAREPVVAELRTSMPSSKVVAAQVEFVGASGRGIYKAPVRGAVHPYRPVSLELRPHPLRGAPANQVTRIICLEGTVWAACDLGIMVWDLEKATREGCAGVGNNLGDEDAASYEFLRVQGSSASCVVADVANQVVWTGHRDGKLRLWPGRVANNASRESRSARLTFQAHRPAVTALVVTPYGELWAGFENGELKAWPWEAVVKVLSAAGDGASLMEKSYTDLRIRNFGMGPNGPINPEVRFLVGDHAHGTVWCAGAQYITLWDARTRELMRMFGGPIGFDLNSLEAGSPGKDILMDEDLKVGYAKVGKKEKGGWLQRSRNAVLGAADAVRRVASGGGLVGDDGKRLEALVAAADGTVWGGYANGLLVQWDWEGYRMQEHFGRPVGVRCMCVVGNRIWIGYSDGKLQVLAGDSGRPVGSWLAHRLAVIQMTVSGGYVYSLGLSGSIRGWNISSPDRNLDGILAATMTNRADLYTRQRHLQVLAGTWNTAQEKSSLQSARTWLATPAAEASVVIVGLQEVEMGAGAIGMAAVKETVGMGPEKLSAAGSWWLGLIDTVLGENKEFERVGWRQLAGMLVGVWVRRKLLPYVGNVEVGAIACGFGRTFGNKGAVGVKLMIFRRTICALTSHLAAHMEHVSRRNADFEHIYSQMSFGRASRANVTVVATAAAGVSSAVQNMWRGGNISRRVSVTSDLHFMEKDPQLFLASDATSEDPELAEADLLIWTGDLNYRIDHLPYEEVLNLIYKRQWDVLLSYDQLRCEMGNGRTFHGLREGAIRFEPTYKYDKMSTVYDTSEKRRIPAWCDRVLFRDSFSSATEFSSSTKQGLTRPCKASVVEYDACMDPEESDHKPVRCMLHVDLSVIDEADRRREYGHIMQSDPQVQTCLAVSGFIPETVLSTNRLVLEDYAPSMLRLSNADRKHPVVYVIHCEGVPEKGPCPCGQHTSPSPKLYNNGGTLSKDQYPRGGYGLPPWLQVVPAAGVLNPCDSVSISVKVGMRPEDRGKDQQDKVVVLAVNVKGVFSSGYKQHWVCVCHGPSSRSHTKEKDVPRRRSQELQRRPSSAEKESHMYLSRSEQASSGLVNSTPDLLL